MSENNPIHLRKLRKITNYDLLGGLIDLNNDRADHYKKATACCSSAEVKEGKVVMRYCRSRVCAICASVKTATLMNRYQSEFERYGEKQLVTLTAKAVNKEELKDRIKLMKKQLQLLRLKSRREGVNLSGIYSIEVTYNEKADTYHPHIHSIVVGTAFHGKWVTNLWYFYCIKNGLECSLKAQDYRHCDEKAFKEVFKYITKFKKNDGSTQNPKVIDTIVSATWGQRSIITFGDVRAQDEEIQEVATYDCEAIEGDIFLWSYSEKVQEADWYSIQTGEALSPLIKPLKILTESRGDPHLCGGERQAIPQNA